jgi:hypothetical protein
MDVRINNCVTAASHKKNRVQGSQIRVGIRLRLTGRSKFLHVNPASNTEHFFGERFNILNNIKLYVYYILMTLVHLVY